MNPDDSNAGKLPSLTAAASNTVLADSPTPPAFLEPPVTFLKIMPWIIAIWLVFSAASCIALHGGHAVYEVNLYLPYYLGPGTLIEKIYDPRQTQLGETYQSRELSYIFDWLDCKFIAWSALHGFAHLMSISFFGFTLAIMLALAKLTRKLGFTRNAILASSAIPFSSSNFFLGGSYVRTAHFGATACLVWMLVVIYSNRSLMRLLAIAILSLAASWFDQQGRFLCLLIGCIMIFLSPDKWKAVIVVLAALFMAGPYNFWISPEITYSLHGYWPSFAFQQIPWANILNHPMVFITNGLEVFESSICQMLGGIDRPDIAMFLLTIVGVQLLKIYGRSPFFMYLLGALGTTATLCGMAAYHPPILSESAKVYFYYGIPSGTLFLLSALAAAKSIRHSRILELIAVSVIALNLSAMPGHIAFAMSHDMYWQKSPALIQAMRKLGANGSNGAKAADADVAKIFYDNR